jgi:hypothetical protein
MNNKKTVRLLGILFLGALVVGQAATGAVVDPVAVAKATREAARKATTTFLVNPPSKPVETRRQVSDLKQHHSVSIRSLFEVVGVLRAAGVSVGTPEDGPAIEAFVKRADPQVLAFYGLYEKDLRSVLWGRWRVHERYRKEVLPEIRKVADGAMSEPYGFAAAHLVGQLMVAELTMERRLRTKPAEIKARASRYAEFFRKAVDVSRTGSPSARRTGLIAELGAISQRLDDADRVVAAGGGAEEISRSEIYRKDKQNCVDYYWLIVYQRVIGNQTKGFELSSYTGEEYSRGKYCPKDCSSATCHPLPPKASVASGSEAALTNKSNLLEASVSGSSPAKRAEQYNRLIEEKKAIREPIESLGYVEEAMREYLKFAEYVSSST